MYVRKQASKETAAMNERTQVPTYPAKRPTDGRQAEAESKAETQSRAAAQRRSNQYRACWSDSGSTDPAPDTAQRQSEGKKREDT